MTTEATDKVRFEAAAATGRAIREACGAEPDPAKIGAAVEGALAAVARIVWERRGPTLNAGEFRRRMKAWAAQAAREASR